MPGTDINAFFITSGKQYLSVYTLVYFRTSTYYYYCSASKCKTYLTLDLSQTKDEQIPDNDWAIGQARLICT